MKHKSRLSTLVKLLLIFILMLIPIIVAASERDTSSGYFEYMNSCAVCHGRDGRGEGPMAEVLKKNPKDLTLLSHENGGSFPETVVYQIIDGRRIFLSHGSSEMPVWGQRFSQTEDNEQAVMLRINEILLYLESLQR